MNIGILYIATGRYITFWEDFFKSAEKYFITEATKHYFVFTDTQNSIEGEDTKRVKRIYQQKLGWPYDTLMRFEIFLKAEKELEQMDYIFFFNANMKFIQNVEAEEFLPIKENLLGIRHPIFLNNRNMFTYDRTPLSLAYMEEDEGENYFMGSLNGGKTKEYLTLIHTLAKNTQKDLENNIVALWHDESHLNRYFYDHKNEVRILPIGYFDAERKKIIEKTKIILQDKGHYRFGGHLWLRGQTNKKLTKFEWQFDNLKNMIKRNFTQFFKSIFHNQTNYVFLQGGLGNQLYMLSYAFYLKKQGFENVRMITFYQKTKGNTKDKNKRNLLTELPEKLDLKLSYIPKYLFAVLKRLQWLPLYKSLWSKIINIDIEPLKEWAVYRPVINHTAIFKYHIGFYQAYQYITNEFKEQIRKVTQELVPNNSSYVVSKNDIAIHIRRGDFFTNGNENIYSRIEVSYYLKALALLSNKIKIEKVYIFSDDFKAIQEDIQKINKLYEVILIEGQSVLEDFAILQQFSNFVIGNSTFAWWTAILAKPDNVVVPKKPWKIEMKGMSPYPKEWIQLENEINI
ncbi:glycosyltransferase family 6 [Capnocytophaga sp. oral taxon 335 str. F0486]|jgi:glycosyltransferase|uniref:family 6 glucosyltransferase n=1 Tax=Capnocytophaga sp. oral taxon 335 TaxID=712215 RepID=UPI00026F2A96|nr:family 6 glucosyltransferase [Capnocytophaga sp. oral taxon 335]EJF37547.1 glycosyltransferase family 6 [Capnocytophaga sp. oral taxon 335 str. F0486]